ncbi:hypothetical protein BGX12_11636 [Fibrobacter sp. UWR4]|nr:hypothetical protein BGX12_11636 [Fibrobacter sp. UWR4]PZW69201.1 hypothetical protein C8E88_101524 [Fibrobacter sp. UWR1]
MTPRGNLYPCKTKKTFPKCKNVHNCTHRYTIRSKNTQSRIKKALLIQQGRVPTSTSCCHMQSYAAGKWVLTAGWDRSIRRDSRQSKLCHERAEHPGVCAVWGRGLRPRIQNMTKAPLDGGAFSHIPNISFRCCAFRSVRGP